MRSTWQQTLGWIVRSFLLLSSLLLVFSMVDTRWNDDYIFNRTLPEHIVEPSREADSDRVSDAKASNSGSSARDNKEEEPVVALQKEFILETFKKERAEIEATSKHTSELFYNKFFLVGGLFGFIILLFKDIFAKIKNGAPDTVAELGGEKSSFTNKKTQQFNSDVQEIDYHFLQLCKTNLLWAMFAIAVIVCLSIDISDRTKINVANNAGAWLASYIEAPLLNVDQNINECLASWHTFRGRAKSAECATLSDKSECAKEEIEKIQNVCHGESGDRIGWESSWRINNDAVGRVVIGPHHDQFGHLLFAIQYHYLTIVLYLIYISLLLIAFPRMKYGAKQRCSSETEAAQSASAENTSIRDDEDRLKSRIALGLFSIVQISLLAFTIITRESSQMVEIKVIPTFLGWGANWWASGNSWVALLSAFFLGLSPTVILLPLLCRLLRGARDRSTATQSS